MLSDKIQKKSTSINWKKEKNNEVFFINFTFSEELRIQKEMISNADNHNPKEINNI
jgi:hypothetical protein